MISNNVLKGAKDAIAPSVADIFNTSIEKKNFRMILKLLELPQYLNVGKKKI